MHRFVLGLQPLKVESDRHPLEFTFQALVKCNFVVAILLEQMFGRFSDVLKDTLKRLCRQVLRILHQHIDSACHDGFPAGNNKVVPQLKQGLINFPMVSILFECARKQSNEPS
jgi:hypothetical protein